MWSTEAVTAIERQCRCAVMAAAISTRCMTRPPRMFPKTLASCGSTTSVISVREVLTGFPAKSREFAVLLFFGTSLLPVVSIHSSARNLCPWVHFFSPRFVALTPILLLYNERL